ncbi:hypothetical protein OC834_007989, partial [Tilletia horrida]
MFLCVTSHSSLSPDDEEDDEDDEENKEEDDEDEEDDKDKEDREQELGRGDRQLCGGSGHCGGGDRSLGLPLHDRRDGVKGAGGGAGLLPLLYSTGWT